MPDTRTPPTGNNIIEARRIRLAPRSGSAMLEVDLEVLPGQLHLIYSDDPDSSRAISDVLLGLCDAAQGEVRLHGRAWAGIPPRDAYRLRSSVGRVASKGNWMDTRSVMENILLPLRHHTVLPDELLHKMACDFAQRFGLPGLPTLLPGQCPEPDLQRAACVRAFMGRPELVILEHPLEFADAGLLPDPSGLFLIARAITPPGRVRRFDTRFFTADASSIAHRVEGVVHADAELVELVWVEIGSEPLADAHMMTKNVLRELDKRLATGPLRHDAPIPFFHFYGGKMQMDILPGH